MFILPPPSWDPTQLAPAEDLWGVEIQTSPKFLSFWACQKFAKNGYHVKHKSYDCFGEKKGLGSDLGQLKAEKDVLKVLIVNPPPLKMSKPKLKNIPKK